mmetsp:Transcript_5359/g.11115  ORF Transcript_5359/g.11115 Transcript_5359/m.11115 type:complete len:152 (-) Transcript_5359:152-607(-)|eukprot:CAMPEP_0204404446 /NCGR_PEP_ID=MMETSP0470-20130426/6652_1 /ASSEMBLY_ACC=CAM_ASM_000385 /TAXON_ID=2969 /ORGANISM="Oxyrrhis marina" /LENGTH=151 /DNA_ID=CAMNT_0051399751 /DNA_START=93 /DNA_END=548 /DNA_ORIENTATION=-
MAMSLFNNQAPLGRFFFDEPLFGAVGIPNFEKDMQRMQRNSRGLGAMDVHEDDKGWTVNLDTPGMSENDIKITNDRNIITISGERKSEKKDEETGYYERTFGKFSRSFTIGDNSDAQNISAKLDNGVLHVSIPKKALPAPEVQHIPITMKK